jgi:endoglucanase
MVNFYILKTLLMVVRKKLKKSKKLAITSACLSAFLIVGVLGVVGAAATTQNTNQDATTKSSTQPSTIALQYTANKTSSPTSSTSPSTKSSASTTGSASATGGSSAATGSTSSSSKNSATANSNSTGPSETSGSPSTLYAYPQSSNATDATAYAASDSSAATVMDRLAKVPVAQWYVGQDSNIQSAVSSYVSSAASANQMPVLVAYNIPERDCGSYSAGGASSDANYSAWISSFAAGIGNRPAIVIVEPDALAGIDCLSTSDQQARLQLIASAVHTLKTQTDAKVYIDAGNSNWQSAATMAQRLNSADIAEADGFSLNISNFYTTSSSVSYGTQLSQDLGGKHFVVDTSRNGNGPDSNDDWCNPAGMAVGQTPTLQTGNGLVDAYLWIKPPGESDGQCGADEGGTAAPAAGVWWPQAALSMLEAAGW